MIESKIMRELIEEARASRKHTADAPVVHPPAPDGIDWSSDYLKYWLDDGDEPDAN